jgi:hypothetical protein
MIKYFISLGILVLILTYYSCNTVEYIDEGKRKLNKNEVTNQTSIKIFINDEEIEKKYYELSFNESPRSAGFYLIWNEFCENDESKSIGLSMPISKPLKENTFPITYVDDFYNFDEDFEQIEKDQFIISYGYFCSEPFLRMRLEEINSGSLTINKLTSTYIDFSIKVDFKTFKIEVGEDPGIEKIRIEAILYF